MRLTKLTARVKFPNTAETDSHGEVWHVVTFPDGDVCEILCKDPQEAIEIVRFYANPDAEGEEGSHENGSGGSHLRHVVKDSCSRQFLTRLLRHAEDRRIRNVAWIKRKPGNRSGTGLHFLDREIQ